MNVDSSTFEEVDLDRSSLLSSSYLQSNLNENNERGFQYERRTSNSPDGQSSNDSVVSDDDCSDDGSCGPSLLCTRWRTDIVQRFHLPYTRYKTSQGIEETCPNASARSSTHSSWRFLSRLFQGSKDQLDVDSPKTEEKKQLMIFPLRRHSRNKPHCDEQGHVYNRIKGHVFLGAILKRIRNGSLQKQPTDISSSTAVIRSFDKNETSHPGVMDSTSDPQLSSVHLVKVKGRLRTLSHFLRHNFS